MKEDKKRSVLSTVLIVLTVLQLVFIFSQSLFDAPASNEESGFIMKIVTPVFELFVGKGNVTMAIIRKTAHFVEFAVLGALTASLAAIYGKRQYLSFAFSLLCCLAAAVTDESIQLLSDGRSGQISDVLLDLSGAAVGTAAIILILLIRKAAKRRSR